MQSKLQIIHKILALAIKINHTKKKTVWTDFSGNCEAFNVRYCGVPYVAEMEYNETVYLDQNTPKAFELIYKHLRDLYEELTEGNYAE